MNVHVPQPWNQKPPAGVDHLRAFGDADALRRPDFNDPVASDYHRKIRFSFGAIDYYDVSKSHGAGAGGFPALRSEGGNERQRQPQGHEKFDGWITSGTVY